jgi:hypothetical protein
MTTKKKIIYFGVALVGAYFLFPQAQTLFEYVKQKVKKKQENDINNKPLDNKVPCNCITTPCNCNK